MDRMTVWYASSRFSVFNFTERAIERRYRRPLEIVDAISSAAWITFEFIS